MLLIQSAPEFAEVLLPFQADLFVVVAYGEILRQHILDIPKSSWSAPNRFHRDESDLHPNPAFRSVLFKLPGAG